MVTIYNGGITMDVPEAELTKFLELGWRLLADVVAEQAAPQPKESKRSKKDQE